MHWLWLHFSVPSEGSDTLLTFLLRCHRPATYNISHAEIAIKNVGEQADDKKLSLNVDHNNDQQLSRLLDFPNAETDSPKVAAEKQRRLLGETEKAPAPETISDAPPPKIDARRGDEKRFVVRADEKFARIQKGCDAEEDKSNNSITLSCSRRPESMRFPWYETKIKRQNYQVAGCNPRRLTVGCARDIWQHVNRQPDVHQHTAISAGREQRTRDFDRG